MYVGFGGLEVDDVGQPVRVRVGVDVAAADGEDLLVLRRRQQHACRLVAFVLVLQPGHGSDRVGAVVVDRAARARDVVPEDVAARVEEPPVLHQDHRRVQTPVRPGLVDLRQRQPLLLGVRPVLGGHRTRRVLAQPAEGDDVTVAELGRRRVPVAVVEVVRLAVRLGRRVEDVRVLVALVAVPARDRERLVAAQHQHPAVLQLDVPGAEHVLRRRDHLVRPVDRVVHRADVNVPASNCSSLLPEPGDQQHLAVVEDDGVHGADRVLRRAARPSGRSRTGRRCPYRSAGGVTSGTWSIV